MMFLVIENYLINYNILLNILEIYMLYLFKWVFKLG